MSTQTKARHANGIQLTGHDSELFSFLDKAYVEQLQSHTHADVPLWTFGTLNQHSQQLISVTMWNGEPGCFCWSVFPAFNRDEYGWATHNGFTTKDDIISVRALDLVRYFFVHGYTASLNRSRWISEPGDRTLERLRYIRGYGGFSTNMPEWDVMKAEFFDWALRALDTVGVLA